MGITGLPGMSGDTAKDIYLQYKRNISKSDLNLDTSVRPVQWYFAIAYKSYCTMAMLRDSPRDLPIEYDEAKHNLVQLREACIRLQAKLLVHSKGYLGIDGTDNAVLTYIQNLTSIVPAATNLERTFYILHRHIIKYKDTSMAYKALSDCTAIINAVDIEIYKLGTQNDVNQSES